MSTISIDQVVVPKDAAKTKGIVALMFERFLEHRVALISVGIIGLFCLIALGADVIASVLHLDPDAQDILNRYGPISAQHWAGTDEAGRDLFIRLIYGTRISLLVAFVSAFASTIIGIFVGTVAGYHGGWIDTALMRLTDSLLALPIFPILIILAAIDIGKLPGLGLLLQGENSSIVKMITIFVLFSWMVQARLVRSAVLSVRESEYVLSAQTVGLSDTMIILREILPNVLSPVIVSVTLAVGQNILFEAALSFLGLGIQPPTPSWGNMLNNALEVVYSAPYQVILPGFLIFLVVVSFNFFGDGLQDALDPKAIKR